MEIDGKGDSKKVAIGNYIMLNTDGELYIGKLLLCYVLTILQINSCRYVVLTDSQRRLMLQKRNTLLMACCYSNLVFISDFQVVLPIFFQRHDQTTCMDLWDALRT